MIRIPRQMLRLMQSARRMTMDRRMLCKNRGSPLSAPPTIPVMEIVTHGGKLLSNAQSRAERSFFQCHEPHMIQRPTAASTAMMIASG